MCDMTFFPDRLLADRQPSQFHAPIIAAKRTRQKQKTLAVLVQSAEIRPSLDIIRTNDKCALQSLGGE
jgi:hypothetical protein